MYIGKIHICDIVSKCSCPILIKPIMHDLYDKGIDGFTNEGGG